MKNSLAVSLVCVIVFSSFLSAQKREFELPIDAKAKLFRQYGYWNYGNVTIPIYNHHTGKKVGSKYADLIRGDFNGDGNLDYAGIFILEDSTKWKDYLIVLLFNGNYYETQILDQASVEMDIVELIPRGREETEVESRKKYQSEYDAIGFGAYEKASDTWFFKDGKFININTSD